MMMDYLLLYVREDGVFGRLSAFGETRDAEKRANVSESTLRSVVRSVIAELIGEKKPLPRSITAAFTLSRRVEILADTLREAIGSLSFFDSLTELPRDEVFFVSASVAAEELPLPRKRGRTLTGVLSLPAFGGYTAAIRTVSPCAVTVSRNCSFF